MSAPAPNELDKVATYRRTVHASTERVWENVHDWEHLPWLHRESFCAIEPLDRGDWGWRARIGLQPASEGRSIELELVLEPDEPRYVSRTLSGPGAGGEIWTRVEALDADRTAIEVEFWLSDVRPEESEALGAGFVKLYTRLWDEDEAMMERRTEQLARLGSRRLQRNDASLGPLDVLRTRLPLVVAHAGRDWRIVEVAGQLFAHATVCPHLLGPLEHAALDGGCVVCPWHGYRFDVVSGRSADGQRLRLPAAPRVVIDPETSEVRLDSPS